MWKHILVQSLFQFVIIFLFYLYAPQFIKQTDPERQKIIQEIENCFGDFPGEKLEIGADGAATFFILDGKKSSWSATTPIIRTIMVDGKEQENYCMFLDEEVMAGPNSMKVRNLYEAYKWYNFQYGNTVHMTMIFNVFVIYTLFNQINSRILDESFNVLKGITKNLFFVVIFAVEVVGHWFIIQRGGIVFKCIEGGLTYDQWMVCIAIGAIALPVSFLIKLLPLEDCFSGHFCESLMEACCCVRKENQLEKLIEMEENAV